VRRTKRSENDVGGRVMVRRDDERVSAARRWNRDEVMQIWRLGNCVVEFGVNDGGGSGASCCGIKLRADTTELYGNSKIWRWPKFGRRR